MFRISTNIVISREEVKRLGNQVFNQAKLKNTRMLAMRTERSPTSASMKKDSSIRLMWIHLTIKFWKVKQEITFVYSLLIHS